MLLDAANDIVIQRKQLSKLERQLDYVTAETRCEPPLNDADYQHQMAMIEKIYNLLNIDNQFAKASIEINLNTWGTLQRRPTF
ncbi:outer membrane protein sypB [Vibrio ishigakensis]|uniref:Outer membrane protein sypB n=1 Tax=Vibrio ishigakensis TaxID=1481914 RepID=A0A0B8NWX2_9VIBR|nr:outer membrane protein sypB [Vibrio ishigakensis]